MMKKIFTKGFIAVALVAVVGFVSSCKDYNDEIMAEYRGGDEALKGEIADLRADLEQGLADAEAERDALEEKLTDEINTVKELYATKAELEAAKTKLENDLDAAKDQHKADIEALDKKIAGVDADLQATKTKLETTIGKLTQAEQNIVALQDAITRLDAKDAALEAEDAKIKQSIEDLKKSFADDQAAQDKKIEAIENVVIPAINGEIATLKEQKDSLANVAKSHEVAIANVNKLIEDLASKHAKDCDSLANVLSDVQDEMAELASKADVQDMIDNLEEGLTNALETEIAGVEDLLLDLYNDLKEVVENNTGAIIELEELVYDEVYKLNEAIADLEEEMQDSIAALRQDLTDLEARVAANEKAIEELATRLDGVEEDLKDLTDAFENRITNISIQGAYSPVVGYFNIPFGIKSNILAAYKGEVIEPTNFPFGYIDGKINELIPLKSSLGYAGEEIEELAHGCAGKLYLTINPAEVNLDSVDFALVNSQNELAPVKFDSVVVSSDVLKFGYTRAGAPLYEASAHITDFDAASLDMNLGDYKDILSDLKNGQMNLTDIASTLYSSINDIAEANAVRASWTDSLGEHSVYSDFAVAAVAVKPLAFTFLQDLNLQSVPGFTRVQNFIDKAFDKVNIALPSFDGLNFTAPEIKKIAIKDFDELGVNTEIIITDTVEYTLNMEVPVEDVVMDDLNGTTQKITVTVPEKTHNVKIDGMPSTILIPAYTIEVPASNFTVDGPTVHIQNVKINKVLEIPFTVKYDMKDIVKDLYGSVTEPIEDVNEMLGDLEDFMDDVNAMLDELKKVQDLEQSITDAVDGIKSQLNSYLDKLNNKLCNAINSLNDKLQPAMFVKTTNGFGMLSQSKNMPTAIESGAVLVPTTYTAELLAPASKKYVAITAVDGSTDNLAAANTGDLNKVLEGDVRAVEFNGQAGKTYELTYAALDYAGNVSTVKYYVTVK